jgi:hypothetical protein
MTAGGITYTEFGLTVTPFVAATTGIAVERWNISASVLS